MLSENIRLKQIAFIVSTGRTGTTFIAKYLQSRFPNCKSIHERNFYTLRILSSLRLSGRFGPNILRSILLRLRNDLNKPDDLKFYIESNSALFGVLDILAGIFKDAKFIHIVRDPRDYVRSCINWGSFKGIKYLFNRFLPYWTPRMTQKNWSNYSKIEIASHWWNIQNREIENGLSFVNSEKKIRLNFENIHPSKDFELLKDLHSFIGLSNKITLEKINRTDKNPSKSALFPRWADWDSTECQQLHQICDELMGKYGYGQELLWFNKIK